MRVRRTRLPLAAIGYALTLGLTAPAMAASHLWRFNEIFTNANGTVQFIELVECCGAPNETFIKDKWVRGDLSNKQYTFPTDLIPPTTNKHLLLATSGFAALAGAPTPDYIIPANFLRMNGDTLRYYVYPDATMTYGAGQLPTNGVHSLNIGGTTGLNSPTNYDGDSGSVNAGVCTDVDQDGYGSPGSPACSGGPQTDCNDANAAINPGATEVCTDTIDNDCDALVDCDDTTCTSFLACIPTLSQWGMIAMALVLLSAATIVLMARRQGAMDARQ